MAKRKKTKPTEKYATSEHVLVPKHDKCSETEKKSVMTRYNVDIKDFPKISINDPALFDLDLKPGDMIKITRDSDTAGKSIFYRIVIEIQ